MSDRPRLPVWVAGSAILLFLVHTLNYLYFFVDDEAIPYVYAQNLLHGKGLIYNTLEGRVEGYSDFLHVWFAAFVLAIVRAFSLPKVSVFFIGKGWSLACGAAIVVLTWAMLRRMRVDRTAAMTGLAFLALAPPLAVWSCSSPSRSRSVSLFWSPRWSSTPIDGRPPRPSCSFSTASMGSSTPAR